MSVAVPEDTRRRQTRASDPAASVWVGANAGSGKTYVLTQRVVRLLLSGTDPGRILCLTFTKAAAAQMAVKVFDTLAEWTRIDDDLLRDRLRGLEGRSVDAETLTRARRLFARALETPGGLKIQTIHAFCEALLHQFPLEANVAGHFEVVDDRGQAELLAASRSDLLHRTASEPGGALGEALDMAMAQASDMAVLEAIDELVAGRDDLIRWIRANGTLDNALKRLRRQFGVADDDTADAVLAEMPRSDDFPRSYLDDLLPALENSGQSDRSLAERLRSALSETEIDRRAEAWQAVFFTTTGAPRKRLVTKKIAERFADIDTRFEREVSRLSALRQRYRAISTLDATVAITRLAEAVVANYEARKAALGLLDFNDLVVRAADLLSRSDAARWVQYKLDLGLDHVLIDEGQDTSPRQWQVIRRLVGEFFAGEGIHERVPTIFAVGDEKQSIYSFQGAAPRLFGEMRRRFKAEAADAGRLFHDERLHLSFRSTPDVLAAVDTVFAAPHVYDGLSQPAEATVHEAVRRRDPGLVEIWPLVEAEPVVEPQDWRQPLDHDGPAEPARRLADRIADTIAGWIATGARLEGTGKRIAPGDILVLVRKRGPFVEALNRALKDRRVAAAGSDRLVVSDHIAVQDLVSLGRAVLLPADDLSLAEVLKSPVVGLDEAALYDLAHRRAPDEPLSEALAARRRDPVFAAAHDLIAAARMRADLVDPYAFFAGILGPGGARARFRARLGAEVDEVLDEFLSLALGYEQTATPSLEGFLAWLAVAPTEIKRQQESEAREVRVMTVHGAKGLESPVVFLVDACSAPFHPSHTPKILPCRPADAPDGPPAPVWTPRTAVATEWRDTAVADYRAGQEEEYRRLLYVAMTRAADRLIVCGFRGKNEPQPGVWYRLVGDALRPAAETVYDEQGGVLAWQWRKTAYPAKPSVDVDRSGPEKPAEPAWLVEPVAPRPVLRPLSPSTALADAGDDAGPWSDADADADEDAVTASLAGETPAQRRGRLVHLLLQHLAGLDRGERRPAAERILVHVAPALAGDGRTALIDEVTAVLGHPDFAHVFDGKSRAEVTVAGSLNTAGGDLPVSGQVDRLVVTDDAVLIVDFKTNRRIPRGLEEISAGYVLQLALYRHLLAELHPGRAVRAALLWTRGPELTEIPKPMLDAALNDFTARQTAI